jgi:hypothetical protein
MIYQEPMKLAESVLTIGEPISWWAFEVATAGSRARPAKGCCRLLKWWASRSGAAVDVYPHQFLRRDVPAGMIAKGWSCCRESSSPTNPRPLWTSPRVDRALELMKTS